jgi:putative DNA primase/helicase
MDILEVFRARMARDGIVTNEQVIPDGELYRFHVQGDKAGVKDGFYVLHQSNGIYGGIFGSWHINGGEYKKWCSKRKEDISPEEYERLLEQINKSKLQYKQERKKRQHEASETARRIWSESKSATDEHPYLVKKDVKALGVRVSANGKLIVPLYGIDKQLHSLQFISSDGEKRFLSSGMISGNYFPIGQIKTPTDKIYIGEGYATCVTLYQVTSCAAACAFNCGNLLSVARVLKAKFVEAEIIIAADNDIYTNNNPGLTKAKEAAISIGIKFVYPNFTGFDVTTKPTDFNDLMRLAGIEEVKKQLENFLAIDDEWPDPDPIQKELLPVESLPIQIIPEPYCDFVLDEAHRMQCPIDFIAVSILEATSAVIGAGCGVKPKKEDDWLVIPNLWGCIIGRPGKLKTPAASSAICFLERLESKEKNIFDDAMRKFEVEQESHKAEKDAIKRKMSSAHSKKLENDIQARAIDVDYLKTMYSNLEEPEKPKRKRFKSNDATVEKLSELLAENSRGLLLYRDELMGLLTTWDKVGHESDRSFFLEAWNGKGTHTTDRIGRGTIDTENMCVSVFGTTQPDKLIRYLSGAMNGNNDGLMQRFQLLVYPDDISWELVDKKPNHKARDRVFNILETLPHMNFSEYGASKDEDGRLFFRFNEEAQKLFYEWLVDLERNKLLADDHHLLLEHLSKYRKLMPALALILHVIDLADGKQSDGISVENAERACALCEYFESHARRIYALVTDIDTLAAAILAKKIEDGKLRDGFTSRDVYRQKGFLKDREIAKIACDELLESGWLREVEKSVAKGQKRKISYLINPKINRGSHHG